MLYACGMKRMTTEQLRSMLIKRCEYPRTQAAFARELGVSLSYLNQVMRGAREPGKKMLRALGLRRRHYYDEVMR